MQQQNFAQRLQSLLNENSLQISDFARDLKVSRQSVYNWINTNTIGKRSLRSVSNYFDVSPNWLRDNDTTEHVSQIVEQRYMKAVNSHLKTMDTLIGNYFFNEHKIHWLGYKRLLLIDGNSLPEIPEQLFERLKKTEQKQLRQLLVNMLEAQQATSRQYALHLAQQKCLCTIIPLKDDNLNLEGVSFNIQPYMN